MNNSIKSDFSVIGAGRLGGALAIALENCGYRIRAIARRNQAQAEILARLLHAQPPIISPENFDQLPASRIIFITTPDPDIQTTAEKLAQLESIRQTKPFVFHTSGALSAEILQSLREIGCRVGSFHPLVSISDAEIGSGRFADAYFCLEGDAEAVSLAETLVSDLRGKSFQIAAKFKTLYHASAVTACGHLVALFDAASEMLQKCGVEIENAREILFPLVKSTVENLAVQTPERALTGTFARADLPTMQKHINAIQSEISAEILQIYATLGLRSLELAEKNGADSENLRRMKQILDNQLPDN